MFSLKSHTCFVHLLNEHIVRKDSARICVTANSPLLVSADDFMAVGLSFCQWAELSVHSCSWGPMTGGQSAVSFFKGLFILCWGLADSQCCDSVR